MDRLLKVCSDCQVECMDLASEMDGNETYFYDDLHFNEAGARQVAEVIAAHFSVPETPESHP